MSKKILIVGSGNAALCAGIAALEKGAAVQIDQEYTMTPFQPQTRHNTGR